jgi:hypothetical protein
MLAGRLANAMIRFLKMQENSANRRRGCGSNPDSIGIRAASPVRQRTLCRKPKPAGMQSPSAYGDNEIRVRLSLRLNPRLTAEQLARVGQIGTNAASGQNGADACLEHAHW